MKQNSIIILSLLVILFILCISHAETNINTFINLLYEIKKEPKYPEQSIYFYGLGRNNNVARLFARRLQNIGYSVFVPGPTDIISSPKYNDISIFISNSGSRDICRSRLRRA